MLQTASQHLFTCLSCSIAFLTAEEQRAHYRSDHHRYNMKRRVASLPPVSLAAFDQKVTERGSHTAVATPATGAFCEVCSKIYSTENAYRSHLGSKKHHQNSLKPLKQHHEDADQPLSAPKDHPKLLDPREAGDDVAGADIDDIDAKIAAARSSLKQEDCLFCPVQSASLHDNLIHMSTSHSFFIPDADYLVDLCGLIRYLGEKVIVGNVCLYCNASSREFRSPDAVRKHMVDKGHCKIAYDSQDDRLELSDYYDFTTSYPVVSQRNQATSQDDWEDIDEDDNNTDATAELAEMVEEPQASNEIDNDQLTYGDTQLELVLPSGARIGHRSMRRYYAQSFTASARYRKDNADPGASLVRRLLAENSPIVSRKGGFGAYGMGTEVVKARNRGEAKEAGRHVREFRDQKRREDFKTKVGFANNHQKHYRDPLLQ